MKKSIYSLLLTTSCSFLFSRVIPIDRVQIITLETPLQSVLVEDYDNDGILDFSVLTKKQVGIFSGKGNGTFSEPIFTPTEADEAFFSAHLNNDNLIDIATVRFEDPTGTTIPRTISILLNNGDNSMKAPINIPLGVYSCCSFPSFKDINKDGVDDILLLRDGELQKFVNNGDGTFQDPSIIISGFGVGELSLVTGGDLDQDGNIDLVLSRSINNAQSFKLMFLMGNEDGSFQSPTFSDIDFPVFLDIIDFDLDGNLDIINTSFRLARTVPLNILRGNGDGSFQENLPLGVEVEETSNSFALNVIRAHSYIDANKDGRTDVADFLTGLFLSDKDLIFQNPLALQGVSAVGDGVVGAGDFNQDGLIDFVLTEIATNNITIITSQVDF